MTDATALLVDLAHAKGVDTQWWDWRGEHRRVPPAALRAVLEAMGEDVTSDATVGAALERVRTQAWRRVLPPTVVQRRGSPARVLVHVPHGCSVSVHVELEGGGRHALAQLDHVVDPREIDGTLVGEAAFEVPDDLPLGWHSLIADIADTADIAEPATSSDRTVLVTVPQQLELPALLQEQPRTGLMTQLYQVRGAGSQGIGDLGDLATLGEWAAREHGFHFVLVNPLHAAEPVAPMEPSPYLPTSRRFINPVYIDLRQVPGLDDVAKCRVVHDEAARKVEEERPWTHPGELVCAEDAGVAGSPVHVQGHRLDRVEQLIE